MPVEFLTDDEAAAYGRYAEMPSQADLDRVFFLDDEDLKLVRRHRGDHMRAGFALQPVTVRWLGRFLEDPLDVPDGVLEFVAGKQLGVAELAEVKRYTEREHTRFEHQWEIKKDRGYREFDDAAEEFARWAAARSRATGDGPKAIFTDGLAWLRERDILLPGVTTVARLVAGVVTDTTRQLHEELAAMPDPVQRRALDRLLDVPPGSRLSDLERWRKGPAPRGSGPSLVKYLDRAAEIGGVGLGRLGAEARVPPRRMAELSRYGMTASASLIRRHGDARRLATLVATVRHLEGKSIDDALELLDLNASAQTIRAYRGDLIQFAAHHDGEVGELSAAPVRAYLADIGGHAASTRKRKRAAVASFCKWAVRHDLLGANPMDKIDTVKVPKSLPRRPRPPTSTGCSTRSAAGGPAKTSRWTGCATGCCSRPPTPAAPAPRRSAACTSRTWTSASTMSTSASTAKAAASGRCCSTTAATSRCSGSTSPAPGTPPGRCSAPPSTDRAGRCPATPPTTAGRATATTPRPTSASTSSATPTAPSSKGAELHLVVCHEREGGWSCR
jgi:hypothetical protein